MSQLGNTLQRVARQLDALGVSWCLVGGLAVSARTEPRFTQDVDVAVATASDDDAEQVVHALQRQGFAVFSVLENDAIGRLATVRLQRRASGWKEVVDVLFASSGIEMEVAASAERLEVMTGLQVPVARAGHLLAMKLLSRDPSTRPQDEIDIARLRSVMDEVEMQRATDAVAAIEELGCARGRDLRAALEAVIPGGSGPLD
jgi:hypothetical protein